MKVGIYSVSGWRQDIPKEERTYNELAVYDTETKRWDEDSKARTVRTARRSLDALDINLEDKEGEEAAYALGEYFSGPGTVPFAVGDPPGEIVEHDGETVAEAGMEPSEEAADGDVETPEIGDSNT